MEIRWPVLVLAAALAGCGGGHTTTDGDGTPVIPVTVTIATTLDRAAISPYIYGTNQALTGTEGWTARRQGGNRMTGYNWENNASNAGADWYHNSDDYLADTMGLPSGEHDTAGRVVGAFHEACQAAGCYTYVTLQMAGYLAADKAGTVTEADAAPSARWKEVRPVKGSAFTLTPSTADGYVYMDELVNFLVTTYGTAASGTGVRAYALDNEPALWPSTHPRIHAAQPTCAELIAKSTALAAAVKAVDAGAETFGPVLYGFGAYLNLQDAPDWSTEGAGYDWFVDYYLARMHAASTTAGKRLLDVLDVHWYSEAQGNGERIVGAAQPHDRANAEARMQAPRTLWDATYTEDSWIGQWFSPVRLIPHFQESIAANYPGTKIAISEFNYGGEDHISGGIAVADVLGIFGRYGVYFASYWQMETVTTYTTAAYKLFRDYDGAGGTFGDTTVQTITADTASSSVYASVFNSGPDDLHIIALNKSYDNALALNFTLAGPVTYTSGRVWAFDPASPAITERAPVTTITANTFTYTVPPLTACHIVLEP